MRRTLALAVTFMVMLAPPAPAGAQRRHRGRAQRGLAARVDELAAKTDEALKAAADSAAAVRAIQDLQNQLTSLKKELELLGMAGRQYEAFRAKLLELEKRTGALELKQSALSLVQTRRRMTAGFRDGFFLQDRFGHYLLRFRGFLQGGYLGRIFTDRYSDSGGTVGEHESTFTLRRARIELHGHVNSKRIRYRLELDFGDQDPGPVLDALGELRVFSFFNLQFGRQRIPIGRQMLIHSAYQQFVERSLVTTHFAPGWDLGLVAQGNIPLVGTLSYQVGLFNGAGSLVTTDENTDFLYAARVVFEPLGQIPYSEGDSDSGRFKMAVGGSFAYNLASTDAVEREAETNATRIKYLLDQDGDGATDNVGIYLVGAELAARLRSFLLQGEFFYRLEDPGAADSQRWFWGAYGQLGFFPLDTGYELATRYSYLQPHYYGLVRDTLRPETIHEVAVVANFFAWNRRFKWQIEYAYQWLLDLTSTASTTPMGSLNVHQIRLQVQLYF